MKNRLFFLVTLLVLAIGLLLVSCPAEGVELYQVIFNSQGGSDVASVDAAKGMSIPEPDTPVKEGYLFDGWYEELEYLNAWNFNTDTVESNMTLYAKWTADTYAITYHANGATAGLAPAVGTKTHDIDFSLSVNIGDLERTGYAYSGWNTQADGLGTDYAAGGAYTANAAITLYAKWTADTYAITYVLNSGTNDAGNPATYTIETATITMQDPTRTGYPFEGWFASSDFSGSPITQLVTGSTGDKTLYAKWKVYQVRDIGPTGGYIFYDKGVYSDGWQYLEAAPSDIVLDASDYTHIFGYHRTVSDGPPVLVGGTSTAVGTGEANTTTLVGAMEGTAYVSNVTDTPTTTGNYAARLCDIHETGGYSDWFLPSKGELDLMYDNLKISGLGSFSALRYWSSSEDNADHAWNQNFFNGDQYSQYKGNVLRIRPIRAF
ncbi:MAG: hypothetical protein CVV48_00275 [Spirochaetae bacterium HGW-Spirochaetae-4]|nr:MAG: hypothetical protein CVV48_00275 [Spirochaetae bacterium HGW-Spirochaetae-4]